MAQATRFVPGTHEKAELPEDVMVDRRKDYDGQVLATGPAGSLIVFNGSAWHGHTANGSDGARRSVQGAFIPRDGRSATFHDLGFYEFLYLSLVIVPLFAFWNRKHRRVGF